MDGRAQVGLDLGPEEARIVVGDIGGRGVTKLLVDAELLELVEERVELGLLIAQAGCGSAGVWQYNGSLRWRWMIGHISRQVAQSPCGAGGRSCAMAWRSCGRL